MLSNTVIKSVAVWFLVAIAGGLLAGWGYAVKTSWQNESRLSSMSDDLKGIKRALIRISLKTSPNDPSIAEDLLSGTPLQKGIEYFTVGKFPAAYATWKNAAATGDGDSAFAIATATAELQEKLKDPKLAPSERSLVQAALRSAPEVIELNGKFIIKPSN
ncbi:hypothetical protein [Oceanimonas sp. MB9]|uniref:hypothetical protein n=1 Tax=Oceanimonas sp. MB9 TaxID=2588453 RepID=UPI0013F63272|nr:hypothetical protein [Oceanimonas sp. MB9]